MKKLTLIHWAAVAGLIACAPATASEARSRIASAPSSTVSVDAKTGNIRPTTDAERAELSRGGVVSMVNWPQTEREARATFRRHADGHMSMVVPVSLWSHTEARTEADGSIVIEHFDHEHGTQHEALPNE